MVVAEILLIVSSILRRNVLGLIKSEAWCGMGVKAFREGLLCHFSLQVSLLITSADPRKSGE